MREAGGARRARRVPLPLLLLLVALAGAPNPVRARGGPAGPPAIDELLQAAAADLEAGRLDRADAAYARAVDLAHAAGDAEREIGALAGRMSVLARRQGAAGLREIATRLAAAQEAAGRPDQARLTQSDLAALLLLAGRSREALDLATALVDRAGAAKDAEVVAAAEETRAGALANLFEMGPAIAAAERAIERWDRLARPQDSARALELLAAILTEIGSVERAERLHGEVLRILGPADSSARANALGNLGFLLYETRGEPERALKPLQEATEIHKRLGDAPSEALGCLHLARAMLLAGATKDASQAIDIALERAGTDSLLAGYAWALRGELHLRDGTGAKASLDACEQALARALSSDARGLEFECRRVRAEGLLAAGEAIAATEEARRAIEIAGILDIGLPDEQAAQARSHVAQAFLVGVRAAVAAGSPPRIAEFLERSRAGALLATLSGREAAWSGVASDKARRVEQEARARVMESDRALRAVAEEGLMPKIRVARERLDAAYSDYVAATDAVEREARLATPGSRLAIGALDRIQAALDPSDAMVLYSVATDPIGALVVLAKDAHWVPLGPRADLEKWVAWADVSGNLKSATEDLESLRTALTKPLGLPKEVRRVLVSPDGALSAVPFPALFSDQDRDVALIPSGTVWTWLRSDGPRRGKDVLALGAPDYSIPRDPASLEVFGRPIVPPLPETDAEVRQIASGQDDVVLSGRDASEERLRAAAGTRARWSLAYFACHGQVNLQRPALSALVLSPSGADDGFLGVHEVFRLRLAADLVVMAACESAVGASVSGEGQYGLPRAFLCAGTPRVIGSLWRVDDGATRELMLTMVNEWKRHVGAAEALRRAQAAVRAVPRWSHPRFWAAWVLWGLPD